MNKLRIFALISLASFVAHAQQPEPLRLLQTIPLPGVKGRIDHLAADVKGQRLFVAALGNNTLEVIDLRSGKRTQSIAGLDEPQGIAYVPEFGKLFVANGGDGACKVYSNELRVVSTVKFSGDADNVRYDPRAKRIYVGYGDGALGVIDAKTNARIHDIKLAAHPESFQLGMSDDRIFVNVPKSEQIAVVDRKKQTVVAKWSMREFRSNYPMALDESNHRLIVGTRSPARLVVIDTKTGKRIADMKCVDDTDDVFYDTSRKRIYVIGGEGAVNVFGQSDPDHYVEIAKVPTSPRARTGLFVPELDRLYVAAPQHANQSASILVYTLSAR